MNGDDYVDDQEGLYRNNADPWSNFSGPRFNVYRQYHRVITSLILPRYKTVVDIGCGVGGLVDLINRTASFEAMGVDSSETAILRAIKKYPAWRYEIGDIRYWEPERNVDMVLATGPYHHLTAGERLRALRHIKSYLNDGGALLIAYGGEVDLDGNIKPYPDLAGEIFSEYKKQQYAQYMYKDGEENGSYVFYVGEK